MLAITPLRFLDLPPELRLAIYAQTIFTDEPLHWIGSGSTTYNTIRPCFAAFLQNLLRTRKDSPTATTQRPVSSYVSTVIALLFTCKTIYREAIELFYQNNNFVIQAMTTGFQPVLRHQPFLSVAQRLCIRFHNTFDRHTMNGNDFLDLADASITSCLQNIIDNCPNLKSLTVCGIPRPALMYRPIWGDDDDSCH